MPINTELKKRPIKFSKQEEINPDGLEKALSHFDARIIELDKRRIAQQSSISAGSSDSETISNLVAGVNAIITALNASSLTED